LENDIADGSKDVDFITVVAIVYFFLNIYIVETLSYFFFLVRIYTKKMLRVPIFTALVFFIMANPEMFKIARRFVGNWVSNESGCPTTKGLFLHTVVFLLACMLLSGIRESLEGVEVEVEEEEEEEEAPSQPNAPPLQPNGKAPPSKLKMGTIPQNNIVGANLSDDASYETVESITNEQNQKQKQKQPVETDLTRMLSGTSWKKCSCEDGGQVLLLG